MRAMELVLVGFLLGVSCTTGVRQEIPAATWERIFFENINQATAAVAMEPLRDKVLAKDTLEVRVWFGFGRSFLKGLVIEHRADSWCAHYVAMTGMEEAKRHEVHPARPWPQVWDELCALGIFRLPDSSTLPQGASVRDGVGYVVEYQTGGRYRTYEYGNPGYQPWPEAESISRIGMLLAKEFSVPFYQAPGSLPVAVKEGQVVLMKRGKAWGAYQLFDLQAGDGRKARVKWVYRTDGESVLAQDGAVSGEFVIDDLPHEFGPFTIRWSSGGGGEAHIYYPDPQGDMLGDPERQFVAITDRQSVAGLDAADSRWQYKAAFVDPLPTR